MHTYAGVRVIWRSPGILIQKRSTVLTLRPRPVMAAVITHATTHAARRFKMSGIEVTRVRVTVTVTPLKENEHQQTKNR